jgi:hypothetical protein
MLTIAVTPASFRADAFHRRPDVIDVGEIADGNINSTLP